jgi:hypothetical protein
VPQQKHAPERRIAYSVDEAAAISGCPATCSMTQMRAGRLAYLEIGRRRIITRQHLEACQTPQVGLAAVQLDGGGATTPTGCRNFGHQRLCHAQPG